jgi:hypothetical protein
VLACEFLLASSFLASHENYVPQAPVVMGSSGDEICQILPSFRKNQGQSDLTKLLLDVQSRRRGGSKRKIPTLWKHFVESEVEQGLCYRSGCNYLKLNGF